MRLEPRILTVIMAVLLVSTGPAAAHPYNASSMFTDASYNYSGTWPVTVTRSRFSNGTDRLTLAQSNKNTFSR
jgi:hypothetical protein